MELISIDQNQKCYHCGDACDTHAVSFQEKKFCCNGCKSVYEILSNSDLTAYYDLESFPGSRIAKDDFKFGFLDLVIPDIDR